MNSGVPSQFLIGNKTVNLIDRRCEEHELTEQDCGLLIALVERKGSVVSKQDLYREVWGYRSIPKGRALDFAIRRLRDKIEDDPKHPEYLEIVRGRGFRLSWQPMPISAVAGRSFTLPPIRSAWIGTTERIDSLKERLANPPTLLSMMGPAGVGKTHLLLEALKGYPQTDLRWIRVREIADTYDLLAALCQAYSVTNLPISGDTESLFNQFALALNGRQDLPLLILDGADAMTTDLQWILSEVTTHSDLKMVLTTRTRLNIRGEHLWPVQPLEHEEAIAFMMQKVSILGSQANYSPEQVDALVQKLDGLPLAMELAAPRLRTLTPQQLEARLSTDLELLSDAPGLSISLPAVIGTSLRQLNESQAKSLWMISLLTRGVTMEQAEVLLKDFGDPIEIITQLMDHSLLLKSEINAQSPRFRVMWAVSSLIQQTMQSRWPEEERALWKKIAEFSLVWVKEDCATQIQNLKARKLRSSLREEYVQAERWVHALTSTRKFDEATELAFAFAKLFVWDGDRRRSIAMLTQLADAPGNHRNKSALMIEAATIAGHTQDWDRANEYLMEAELSCPPDPHSELAVRVTETVLEGFQGRHLDALHRLNRLETEVNDETPYKIRMTLVQIKHYALVISNQLEAAKKVFREMQHLVDAGGTDGDRYLCMTNEAYYAFGRGDPHQAAFIYRKQYRISLMLGNKEEMAGAQRRLSHALSLCGDPNGAHRARIEAMANLHPEGNADAYTTLLADDAFFHSGQNRQDEAVADMRRAMELCDQGVKKSTMRMVLSKAVHMGLLIEGEYPFHDAVEKLEQLTLDEDYSPEKAVLLSVRAFLMAREERYPEALETADRAWEGGKKNLGQVDTLYLLGRLAAIAAAAGDPERTKNWLGIADKTYGEQKSWRAVLHNNNWYKMARASLES